MKGAKRGVMDGIIDTTKFGDKTTPMPKEAKSNSTEREIVIRISPRRALKLLMVVLILVSTFYLGRLSADPSEINLSGFSIASLFAKDNNSSAKKATPSVAKVEAVAPATTTETMQETAVEAVSADAPADAVAVPADSTEYATKYGKQVAAIEEVKTTWLGTWGKITDVTYTVKNDDPQPIKASYLKLMVEGYDDYEKKVTIPVSLQVVEGSSKKQVTVKVPQGFAYNPTTAGDLNGVTVTVALYDGADAGISTVTKEVALKSS